MEIADKRNPPSAPLIDPRLEADLLRHEIETFNDRYAAALDEQRFTDWTEMFTDDAIYVIVSRRISTGTCRSA